MTSADSPLVTTRRLYGNSIAEFFGSVKGLERKGRAGAGEDGKRPEA